MCRTTGTAAACRAGPITAPPCSSWRRSEVFRTHWQIAGHVTDVPNPGDYLTLDVAGERALIMRGEDGVVRAFHNLCRHRGSRVVARQAGPLQECARLPVPWLGLQSRRHAARRGAAEQLRRTRQDAVRPEAARDSKSGMGFIFLRFAPGPQPSVAELLAPFAEELGALPHGRAGADRRYL